MRRLPEFLDRNWFSKGRADASGESLITHLEGRAIVE
jgi:hypothetical protein